ncbi:sugar transferase, PEP-CTERM/EpsH1 system associated [Thiorhodococcus drewsii AZ1]|uniref:Sugar transferase, PEP-CTERM/EpsH1 system associated n=1 Tax=Thiorhodococcus drewsii AZ1 TaxID=765913 RepID=G2E8C7_9GAMM|nr:TIGR03087 family PEP-CTERM/XrtA system glycosyltransferase [Thiorhodococcus drewsii]EGV27639.1 sugar transferase, PEP-CTERM/EpsH1 system associated [Thiorhodococcus drewsii AZ1]
MRKKLLFLVHRLPYPPNKGDKITSFNLLRYLAQRYEVYLGTFVDDPDDRQHVGIVKSYCRASCIPEIIPTWGRLRSLQGLLSGEPLSIPYLRHPELKRWVCAVLENEMPQAVLVYSGAMAQYVSGRLALPMRSVLDFDDVDSEKWRSYSASKAWPVRWLYAREAKRLLEFERRMAAELDISLFISREEARLFARLAPESVERVTYRTQGVDSQYFDPALTFENPYPPGAEPLVFTGAMDYWPNIEAVLWFADAVLPRIRAARPAVEFFIVGMRPSSDVQKLAARPGIRVTGGVPDVRPYLAHARMAVLPLRIARGIQNKALEAMAMELPMVATSDALTGILSHQSFAPRVAERAEDFADQVLAVLKSPPPPESRGRDLVLAEYDWEANLRLIEQLLETGQIPAARAVV